MSRALVLPLIAAILLCTGESRAADDTFPGVKDLMTPEQYRAAGLEKLTPEEREVLDRWLLEYTAWEAPKVLESSPEVQELVDEKENQDIHARVKPPFTGWSGKTVFYLDNGQVWRQRLSGRFHYSGEDTAVLIRKNFLGFYTMTHVASGKTVGVSPTD